MIEHLDEEGRPCTRHLRPATDALLAWAAVGSRISGYHHDSASKLQSLMMALDEISELVGEERAELRAQVDTALAALRDLHALLTENRALAKPPQRTQIALADLVQRAAARVGVRLAGEVPAHAVHVAPPSVVHALAMLLDLAAGGMQGPRSVSIVVSAPVSQHARDVTVSFAGTPLSPPPALANESIAIATFLLAREDGALRCGPLGFVVQLPTSARSVVDSP